MNQPTQCARAEHLRHELFVGLSEMRDEATAWRWIVGMVYAIVALTMPEAVSE